jgi:hypothetical protein
MLGDFIATLDNVIFPTSDRFNFRAICQAVLDRYYQVLVARLLHAGYEFPPPASYTESFGHHLPTSFICTRKDGLVLDPGVQNRCLVFLNEGRGSTVLVYIVRVVVHTNDVLRFIGEGAHIMMQKIDDTDVKGSVIFSRCRRETPRGPTK